MTTIDQQHIPFYQQRWVTPPPTTTLPPQVVSKVALRFATPASSPRDVSISPSSNSKQKTFLPRTALQGSADHNTNFEKLLGFQEWLHRREFWEECAILERMHYKNKSQHRQAGYFQRLCECRRLTSRIKEVNMVGLIDELVKKFYSEKSLKTVSASNLQWDSIPYRSTVAFTMTRIISLVLLHKKLQTALHETYGACYQLMSKTQFMSFALVAIGLCSRLSLLSKAWVGELMDCYELLSEWIKSFPNEKGHSELVDFEAQLPESLQSIVVGYHSEDSDALSLPLTIHSSKRHEESPTLAQDLGEVIQRSSFLPSSESPLAPHTLHISKQRTISSSSSDKSNCEEGNDISFNSDGNRRSDLFMENDNVFGKMASSSLAGMEKPKKMKLDLDTIFSKDEKQKRQGIKEKKKLGKKYSGNGTESNSSTSPSIRSSPEPSTRIRLESGKGSIGNFDDIFDHDQSKIAPPSPSVKGSAPLPRKAVQKEKSKGKGNNKREIEDIFGAIINQKKSKTTEIDNIFGLSVKKKDKLIK
ncbi:hypothetical protein BX616_001190 [Lobosporangium transversale]|uniref:Nucleolus and neural progenitor protein-like N-terminal domain-containing protein n=1 Tax=Lobosporangium transversale TaxID=64571 RepID=A0A1Y2GRA1_9FUNG|nr:hypothetical protein BCR41DRAFT_421160 [Lobosporangium transversale]KAF9917376.1 hypothetical protein BX616_001190 [Lobosporangium transversale]ORZ20053.1 hypothetical protein BCR41DRAFT_421160 [Lobosporangium transversale]|eukprot:XP_021882593.1 hypothetical protein BCR41DRAFT_421160 [Lobosporangium transversale]